MKNENFPKNNMTETLLFTLWKAENVEFFYDNWICNSVKDYITLAKVRAFFIHIENIKLYYWICRSINDFHTFLKAGVQRAPIENIKFFHERWICKSVDDFIILYKTWLLRADIKTIEFVHDKWICSSFEDYYKYGVLIACCDESSLKILIGFYEQKNDYEQRIELFCDVSNSSYNEENINKVIHKISSLPLSEAKKYVEICRMFDKSSSFEIQIVKDCLIMDILNKENPEDVIKKIDAIFLLSNLPQISKIFQVFKYVYNNDTLDTTFKNHNNPSHYLASLNTYNKKLDTIYKDLMNIMIKSWESSLKEFLQTIISNKSTLYNFENWKKLNVEECNQTLRLLKIIISLNTLIKNDTTNNIEILEHQWDIDYNTLKEYYERIKQSLFINHNDSIYNFFLKLCKKVWYNTLEDIILDMDESQKMAHINWLSLYNSHQIWQTFKPSNNFFLKWIRSESFWEILNRWVTSSEYLWWWEGTEDKISSNGTPFDTDGVMMNWDNILNVAKTHWYWNIDILIDTDKEWIYNTDNGMQWYSSNMYEVFKNHWWLNTNWYWIRTWVSSTEFDAIILKTWETPLQEVQKIKYLISKNWHYLPVLDLEWNLIFTPEEYHILRQSFSFSDKYKWYDVDQINWVYNLSNQINRWGERLNTFIQEQKNQIRWNVNIDDENYG